MDIRGGNIRTDIKEIGFNLKIWMDSSQEKDYRRSFEGVELNLQLTLAIEFVP